MGQTKYWFSILAAMAALSGCSESQNSTEIGSGDQGATGGSAGEDTGGDSKGATTGGGTGSGSTTGGSSTPDKADADLDGFTKEQGDCEDTSPEINPGAIDFPGNDYDEDCSGAPAAAGEDPMGCDSGSLKLDSTSPEDAARAIGLCKFIKESDKGWGVISAKFTTADGSGTLEDPLMVGLLPSFGVVQPRAGSSVLALSSGVARAVGQPGYTSDCDTFKAGVTGAEPPAGYPKESSECKSQSGGILGGLFGSDPKVFNQVALELKIRVPSNARSFAFDSMFYTYEYPDYICSEYNDFFVVFKQPRPELAPDDNILFDSMQNTVGVNSGLLAVCNPQDQGQGATKTFTCDQGTDLLKGTGFAAGEALCGDPVPLFPIGNRTPDNIGGASTGWLQTTAPVSRSEVMTLRFTVWDTGDAVLDSTAIIDNFRFSVDDTTPATTPIKVD